MADQQPEYSSLRRADTVATDVTDATDTTDYSAAGLGFSFAKVWTREEISDLIVEVFTSVTDQYESLQTLAVVAPEVWKRFEDIAYEWKASDNNADEEQDIARNERTDKAYGIVMGWIMERDQEAKPFLHDAEKQKESYVTSLKEVLVTDRAATERVAQLIADPESLYTTR